MGELEKSNTT